MAKNVLSLQLLRNSALFSNYEAAVSGITGASTNDGTIKLARYNEAGTTKTIFGIFHDMNSETGYTIYDADKVKVDGIISRLDAIDGGGSSSGTIDQKIAEAVDALDSTGFIGDGNQVVTAVTENNGIVTAAGANVGTLTLAGYDEGTNSGKVESTDSINAALAKLQNQIDAANDAKTAAINALDYTDTATTGYYVSKVDQTDGVISATHVALPTVAAISEAGKPITAVSESLGTISATAGTINAEYVNVADAGNVFTASTVEGVLAEMDAAYKAADAAIVGDATAEGNTLGKLEDRIEALDADAKEYHIVKTTTDLPETVKERYSLVDADGNVSGETIDIAKDSHIVSINYITTGEHAQNLEYVYIDASGNTQTTYVDMSQLVLETEFGSGVTVTNHVAHGVVDPTSEKDSNNAAFLTVGADGFKVDGIKAEIAKQVGDAVSGLDVADSAVAGQYVSSVSETDGKITVSRADVSKAVLNDYAKGTDATAVAATDTVNGAISKLENQIDKAKAAATTKVVEGTDAGNNMTITPTTGDDGSVTYTVDLADVASKAALDAEIAARKVVDGQTGQTYAANTSANYVSGATSLNDADVKLDSALKAVSDRLTGATTAITDNSQTHISGTVAQADGKITAFTLSESDIASDAELGAVETAVGLNADGTHKTTTGNYTSGASTIAGEVAALDTQVKANADNIAALSGASLSGVTVNTKPLSVANNVASITVDGKTTEAAADGNKAIIVETDANGNLTLGLAYIDAGEY